MQEQIVKHYAKHLQEIATRIENGIEDFIKLIITISKCTKKQAKKVYNEYKKAKVIKQDKNSGCVKVIHGEFLDREVINNAINI